MECSICGSYRHGAASCPGIIPRMERNKEGQYLCPKCGKAWGQNDYAIDCCSNKKEEKISS